MPPKLSLEAYAELIGVNISEVGALKLRPTIEGAHYVDPFGFNDANGYVYDSEYRVLRDSLAAASWNSREDEIFTNEGYTPIEATELLFAKFVRHAEIEDDE